MVTCGDSFLVRQSQGTEVNDISLPDFPPIQNLSQAVLKIGKVPVNKGIQSKEDEKDIKESSHIDTFFLELLVSFSLSFCVDLSIGVSG